MCGIAGVVKTEPGSFVEAAAIQRMCGTMVHRGPDDEGFYVNGGVGLGMRRLSIIDLSGGHQPVHNEDKSIWVVFNGEIYNFLELRAELERSGHHFYTHTDTEVLVHLYEELGTRCVEKLRGMFAFALFDERHQRLFLARDRFGKKPLHYAEDRGRLILGSEIKSILAFAPELADINYDALVQYFYFGYIPDPWTAFRRIKKLPPGYALEFERGQLKLYQYWDLPAYGSAAPTSEEEYLEEMECQLGEAVRIRLISDVPLGAFLSGGLDSSTVVAMMARASSKPVKTFTVGFTQKDFDETNAARAVAKRFGTEHHELVAEPRVGETLERLSGSLEEPFADSSILPTYWISSLARKHVTVALSGDGGDEVFAGYQRYAISLQRRVFDHFPAAGGRWFRTSVHPRVPAFLRGRNFLYNVSLAGVDRYLDSISLLPVFHRERALFSEEFLAAGKDSMSPSEAFQRYFAGAPSSSWLSRLLYLDTKTYLAGDILTKVDRMSMAASLELRAPLLDHVFVEWATRLPENVKFQNGQGKRLLRKLAERVGVPRNVLHRPKKGFSLPLVYWTRNELKDGLLPILLESRALQRGYFNPKQVRNLLEEHWQCRRDNSGKIWALLMFELWHRNFLEKTCAEWQEVPCQPEIIALKSIGSGTTLASTRLGRIACLK